MNHPLPPTRSHNSERHRTPKRVFLSYAREDTPLAIKLASAIDEFAGESLILRIDAWSLEPGSDLATTIASMVQGSDAMVVVLPSDGTHNWIGAELALGLAKSESDDNFLLIPIRPPGATVPMLLQNRIHLDLAHSDVNTAALKIIEAVTSERPAGPTFLEGRDLLVTAQRHVLEVQKEEYERAKADSKWIFTVTLLVAVLTILVAITPIIAPQDKLAERLWTFVAPIAAALLGYVLGRKKMLTSINSLDLHRERGRND